MAIVIPDHDSRSIKMFIQGLKAAHWKVSSRDVLYPKIGDTVADYCSAITAVHSSCSSTVEPIILKTPPCTNPGPIGSYLWEPFNRPEHSLCFGQNDDNFNKDETSKMILSTPKPAILTDDPTRIHTLRKC